MQITLTASTDNLDGLFRFELKEIGYNLIEWVEITEESYHDRIIALAKQGKDKEIFYRWKNPHIGKLWEPIEDYYENNATAFQMLKLQDLAPYRIKNALKKDLYCTKINKISKTIVTSLGGTTSQPYYSKAISNISNLLYHLSNPDNYLDKQIDFKNGKVCHATSNGKPKYNLDPENLILDCLNMIDPMLKIQ